MEETKVVKRGESLDEYLASSLVGKKVGHWVASMVSMLGVLMAG